MKKVIHILSSDSLSGAEKVAISIIQTCKDEIQSFYLCPNGEIENVLKDLEIEHIAIDNINPIKIYNILKKYKPDIVHAHDFKASVKLAFTPYKCKKISHIHQNPPWIYGINIKIILYFISCFFYEKIYIVSKNVFKQSIVDRYFDKKIKIAQNYIDKDKIIKLSEIECSNKKYDLLFVGRLSNEKDPLRFIKIVEKIVNKNKNINAAIIGNGDLKDKCIDYIIDNSLEKNIEVLGYLSNPYPIMKLSKILIVTSKWEGFGLAVVEALTLGKPVIATPVGELNNIINGQNGKLCNDDDEYCEIIELLLYDLNYYDKISKNAKKSSIVYEKKFDWLNEYRFL